MSRTGTTVCEIASEPLQECAAANEAEARKHTMMNPSMQWQVAPLLVLPQTTYVPPEVNSQEYIGQNMRVAHEVSSSTAIACQYCTGMQGC